MRTGTNYMQSSILNFNNIIWPKGYLNNNYSKKSTKSKINIKRNYPYDGIYK